MEVVDSNVFDNILNGIIFNKYKYIKFIYLYIII